MYKRNLLESPRVQHEREKFHFNSQARRREHEVAVAELARFEDEHWEDFIERASYEELKRQWFAKTALPAAIRITALIPALDRIPATRVTSVFIPCCDAKNDDGNNACVFCFQGDSDHAMIEVDYAPWPQVGSIVVCISRMEWWNGTERFREQRAWVMGYMILLLRFTMLRPLRDHFRTIAKNMIWPPYAVLVKEPGSFTCPTQ